MTSGVAELGRNLGVGNAVRLRQGRGDLVLGAKAHLHEQFTQQAVVAAAVLAGEGLLDLLLGHNTPTEQELSQLQFFSNR